MDHKFVSAAESTTGEKKNIHTHHGMCRGLALRMARCRRPEKSGEPTQRQGMEHQEWKEETNLVKTECHR
jgi:hypothetical protein